MKSKHLLALAVFGLTNYVAAQDPAPTQIAPPEDETTDTIEVTSTRLPRDVSQSVTAVTVITQKQIAAQKPFDLTEIISRAPGLAVSRTGSTGQVASVRLRGAEADHTLVMLDGVRVNSPSNGQFDFGTIPVENIERVEILRGPQSGLYGSEALGGVINIITRRGIGAFSTGGTFEYGSRNTNKQVVTAGGELKSGRLSFSATRLSSDGFFTNDDYKNVGASLRYDYSLSERSTLTFLTRAESGEVGAPGQRALSFDPNARSKPRNWTSSLQWNNEAGARRDKVAFGFFDRRLSFNDPANAPGGSFNFNRFDDQIAQLEGQTSWTRGAHTLTFGGEYRREKANININSGGPFGPFTANFAPKRNNLAFFAQDEWRQGKFALVPSLRWEDNGQLGSDFNGRLAAAYQLGANGKLRASAGTGFRAPTFNELYFPNFGNANLQPEKNTGFDVGYERSFKNGGRAEVTAFYNRFRDLIGNDPTTFLPANIDRATTKGLELFLSQPLGKTWTLALNQTLQNVDSANSAYLLRRPKYATAADLIYRKDKWTGDLAVISQGRRFDDDFTFRPGSRGYYPGFTRLDLTVGYDIRPGLELYARFGNLLNRRYEEVAGFPSPRFNVVFGIKAKAF